MENNKKKEYKQSDQPYHTRKTKDWRKKHKAKGLCVDCKREAVTNKTRCKYHLDYHRFYKKFKGKKK